MLPLRHDQFDLSAQEFQDALALCYRKPLLGLPANCDGCGSSFTIEHALDCRFVGLVTRRHNEVWDAIGNLASLVWGQVSREPIVCEATAGSQDILVVDLAVRGFGNLNVKLYLTSRWWIQMLPHIDLVLPKMCYALLSL